LVNKQYDLIGDVHGNAFVLVGLLEKMGYQLGDSGYAHPERTVIFLGDYIDRGPEQVETLEIVMSMVASGAAVALMGNHEFNALSMLTRDPERPKERLRPMSDSNFMMHCEFLAAVKTHADMLPILAFFRGLPLWLDLPDLRAVHACWDDRAIAAIRPYLNDDNTLTTEGLIAANKEGSAAFVAVETLLKGIECPLPDTDMFDDFNGETRRHFRAKWWLDSAETIHDMASPEGIIKPEKRHLPPFLDVLIGYSGPKPLFIGHYWLPWNDITPQPLKPQVACLDYFVDFDQLLVGYRWQGESALTAENYVWVLEKERVWDL